MSYLVFHVNIENIELMPRYITKNVKKCDVGYMEIHEEHFDKVIGDMA